MGDYNAGSTPIGVVLTGTSGAPISGGVATTDSAGNPLPANFDSLAQTLAYDGSGYLTSIVVVSGSSTYTQTLTYTSGNLTGVSAWVKS